MAFENHSTVSLLASPTEFRTPSATASLDHVLSTIMETIAPFIVETRHLDLDALPPFIVFLVYKAARISTARISTKLDDIDELVRLSILRKFLNLAGKRWLSGGKSDGSLQRSGS
jgi:hypothetical protein